MLVKSLGNTGITVSELCFGALNIGPLQKNLSIEEGGRLILEGFERGISFVNTAEQYMTDEYIRYALDRYAGTPVVATKSLAVTYADMATSIETALKNYGREYIDIFHLHAARASSTVFEERAGALKCLLDYKRLGFIRAVGISTHNVKVVEKAAAMDEIDVVFPLINMIGRGILEGSLEEMEQAIAAAHKKGKGIYAMKVLVGGYLITNLLEAISFIRKNDSIDAVAIGMTSREELMMNLRVFNGEDIDEKELPKRSTKKVLIAGIFCKKCGACIEICPNHALTMGSDCVVVEPEQCLLCGYCLAKCPELAIRLI